jgi:hypothetical protein
MVENSQIDIHIYTCAYSYVCVYVYIFTYKHIYYIFIDVYIYTDTYLYIQGILFAYKSFMMTYTDRFKFTCSKNLYSFTYVCINICVLI